MAAGASSSGKVRVMSGLGSSFGFAEEADGFGEGAAAGADDREFFYDDGPRFDGGGAVKRGLQDQRAARFGDVLSQRQARRRAGGFNDQREILFYFFQIGVGARNLLRFDARFARLFFFAVCGGVHQLQFHSRVFRTSPRAGFRFSGHARSTAPAFHRQERRPRGIALRRSDPGFRRRRPAVRRRRIARRGRNSGRCRFSTGSARYSAKAPS